MDATTLLDLLRDYYTRHHEIPSISAMSLLCAKPQETVEQWFLVLMEEGYFDNLQRPKPKERFFETGIAKDSIPAGVPTAVNSLGADSINLNNYLIKNPSRTIVIKVKGDSMIDMGIHSGDMVLVEMMKSSTSGDVVVANIDGEYTLKVLVKNKSGYFLKAANDKYPDLIPKGALEIVGVMVGLIRKIH